MTDDDDDDDDELEDGAPPPIEPDPGPAANPRLRRKKQARAEIVERDSGLFWRRVLADPVGRREIWALLHIASCFNERHASGPSGVPDPEATAYYRGQRDFAFNWYLRLAKVDRPGVFLMHDEHDGIRFPQKERKPK